MTGRTRIAPTPSGFLHFGNLVNFQLVSEVATVLNLRLRLRIDDIDAERSRPDYTEDIFRWLQVLGIEPDEGPRDIASALNSPQSLKVAEYRKVMAELAEAGADLFVCNCSRTARSAGRCIAGCQRSLSDFDPIGAGQSMRVRIAGIEQALWNRSDLPTYHLMNLAEDRDVTHVVRGDDLRESSRLHAALAALLPARQVPKYAHHPLFTGTDGAKLAKSQGAGPLPLEAKTVALIQRETERLLPGVLQQFQTD